MRATIRLDGLLLIDAETEVEGFALRKWHESHAEELGKSKIKIALTFNPKVIDYPSDSAEAGEGEG